MSAGFHDLQTLDLSEILKEVATLCVEVRSLAESQVTVIPLIKPLSTQSLPP